MLLWSLIKMLVFFVVVAALAIGAGYLLDFDGGVTISLGTTEFNLTPFRAVLLLGVTLLGFWILLKLVGLLIATLRFLNGDETAMSRFFDRNREARGYRALNEAMIAMASGEGREALRGVQRAERLLQSPQLTNLIAAQAAEMAGDAGKAEAAYKRLLTNDQTRFVGVRGIMKQRLADGDKETAMKLAEKAFGLKPGNEEVQDALLQLQAEKSDWDGARKTLSAKLSSGTLPRDVHRRRDAVLGFSAGKAALEAGDTARAQAAFIDANQRSPDFVPAAVMAAHANVERGQKRPAANLTKKAWKTEPHPDLAAAFAMIEPDESAQARIRRFDALAKLAPNHSETKMMQAELLIAAEDFPGARRALGDLVEKEPTVRALTIMAAIERGEGSDEAVVRGWLTKAATAPRGPQWICDNCNTVLAEWTPICSECGAFDTISWRAAPTAEVSMPRSTEMLPLIVGGTDKSGALVPAEVEAEVVEASVEKAEEAKA